MKLIIFFLFTIFSLNTWAYPNYIGHGYTSCLNCHYNPFGGGQLTDYGRATSGTIISSTTFYPKDWDEEKISYTSGFLFRKPKQNWIRTQANYRGFRMVSNPGGDEHSQWIIMQLDARVALKFGENDKNVFIADYGRIPELQAPPPGNHTNKYRTRNMYFGHKFSSQFGLYAGLMDKVYGVRVVEHTAFTRTNPLLTQNDQTIGVAAHLLPEGWEGGIHAFAGNTNQDSEYRQKGISTMWEKTFSKTHRLGGSFLSSKSEHLTIRSYSVHGRFGFQEGSAILAELGQAEKTDHDIGKSPTSRFGLLQTYVRPFRGLYVFANVDYQKLDISEDNYTVRWGPGIQYFPIQRIELRADIYDTRNFDSNNSTKDSWLYLLQTHIWL